LCPHRPVGQEYTQGEAELHPYVIVHPTAKNIRIFTIECREYRSNAVEVKPLEKEVLLHFHPSLALTTDLFGSIHNHSATGSFRIPLTETEVEYYSNKSNNIAHSNKNFNFFLFTLYTI
jgi:hypothetical protein